MAAEAVFGPMRTVVRDGVALRYTDAGAGNPPLLFIHGWCCNRQFWGEQVPVFAQRQRVVAADLRGHGESDKPDQDYSITGFVDDVAYLCRELRQEQPAIVGHSMGGVIALNLARKEPGLPRTIVLVDSPVVPVPAALRAALDAVFAGLKSPAYVETAKSFVSQFMFRDDSDPALKDWILQKMASAPQRVMWSALESTVAEENMVPGPPPVPSLYVRASTQLASAEEIRERYPGIRVEEFEAAHFLHMERPKQFNALLARWLEGGL